MRLRPPPRPRDPLAKLLALNRFRDIPQSFLLHMQTLPLGVLVRGTLEWLLDDQLLTQLFHDNAPDHYTRELTLGALVKLLIQVSSGARPSVYAAFKADQDLANPSITTSFQALYGKLGRMQPAVSEALVRSSAARLGRLQQRQPPAAAEPVAGYRLRILDGNVLAGTDHRLKPLRRWLNTCLPGKSLVVYEPTCALVTDLVLCQDAYTQERALLAHVLPRVQANDLWVADRNFCTSRLVFGVVDRDGFFLIRQHRRNLPCRPLRRLRRCGVTTTAIVYEQPVETTDPETGVTLRLRRLELRLFEKTRDGERTLALLTNLPETVTALTLAETYRARWTIETHFQWLTQSLHCEVPSLGQPCAALLLFALSLVAGNALAVVRGSLRAAQGREAEAEVSGYYLADEIGADYRTLMKYLPADQWTGWRRLDEQALVQLLTTIAGAVRLGALTRSRRGPKKPPAQKPVYNKKHKHYSTDRLLKEEEDSC